MKHKTLKLAEFIGRVYERFGDRLALKLLSRLFNTGCVWREP